MTLRITAAGRRTEVSLWTPLNWSFTGHTFNITAVCLCMSVCIGLCVRVCACSLSLSSLCTRACCVSSSYVCVSQQLLPVSADVTLVQGSKVELSSGVIQLQMLRRSGPSRVPSFIWTLKRRDARYVCECFRPGDVLPVDGPRQPHG